MSAGTDRVGAITAAVDVGPSTVSAHLRVLAEVRFVSAERHGTSTFYRVNGACVQCFPTAADVVMGRPVPAVRSGTSIRALPAEITNRVGRFRRTPIASNMPVVPGTYTFADDGYGLSPPRPIHPQP
jgi:DNA-binding transcriptional ArsR family regulator